MAENYSRDVAASSGCPKALLLHAEAGSPEDERVASLLDCLGVPWQSRSLRDMQHAPPSAERFCVITSVSCVTALWPHPASTAKNLPRWMRDADSVFLYGFAADSASEALLRLLTGDAHARIRMLGPGPVSVSVSDEHGEMCGAMAGLHFQGQAAEKLAVFELGNQIERVKSVVSTNHGEILVTAKMDGATFFLSAPANVVNVKAPSLKYLDVRERFADTLPFILYMRSAFAIGSVAEVSAALIVDDPPLKPRYGFMKYKQILGWMDKHNFATTIAFIPWNWRRTERRTVELFQDRPDRLSLCVHGCDHTAAEFAERCGPLLNKRVKVANERMQLLKRRTKLQHDHVMLFPQGAFCAGAARALKLNGFVAVANTEVTPVHRGENRTTVGDLLGMAIMKYSSLPMFTRRYLAHGVENFAFDGLLGKPCLIAAHHDDFAADARILLEVIAQLNSLNWNLKWRSLGEAIKRSCSVRKRKDGAGWVEMYGTTLIYRDDGAGNTERGENKVLFLKEESDFQSVQSVTVNGVAVDHMYQRGYLQFEAEVPPNESVEARIVYSGADELPATDDGVKYRAKAVLRRYLSEFRDNYLSQNAHLYHQALRIKGALRL